jgi:hypothetical protein
VFAVVFAISSVKRLLGLPLSRLPGCGIIEDVSKQIARENSARAARALSRLLALIYVNFSHINRIIYPDWHAYCLIN